MPEDQIIWVWNLINRASINYSPLLATCAWHNYILLRYICTSPKSLFSLLELSFSLLELSFSPFPLRNSRLHPIYNSREQTRITYFSVAKTCFLKMQFSSSVILVYMRITFLYTRIAFLLAREKQKFSSTRELLFLTRELLGISVL